MGNETYGTYESPSAETLQTQVNTRFLIELICHNITSDETITLANTELPDPIFDYLDSWALECDWYRDNDYPLDNITFTLTRLDGQTFEVLPYQLLIDYMSGDNYTN